MGMLIGCVSGTKPADTYVGKDGLTTFIESDSETCRRSCNESYSRCMDSRAAGDNNSGVIGPSGVYGASGECRNALKSCLPTCKAQ
jgi:hypothetical protein